MQSKLDLIEKLDNELIKYMKLQGKSELKLMIDALELYIPIRSNLKAMLLAEPNIAALLNTPDLLLAIDVIKEKFYMDCPASDCTEFTFKLVNEVYRNERAKLLAAKVQNENAAHKNELKTLPPEEIIDRAFQTNIYNDYEIMLSEPDLTARQIDTLMTYPNILNSLYVEWICGSYVHTDELEDCLKKCIEDQDIYLQGNPDCGVDKGEKEIWDKMYEGDEFRVPLNCEAADKEAGEELEP